MIRPDARYEWTAIRRGPGTGYMFSGADGQEHPACASCRGLKDTPAARQDFISDAIGHRPGCATASSIEREIANGEFKPALAANVVYGLYEALEQIAGLRPTGNVTRCANFRKLVEQMEIIALVALRKAVE